MKNLCVYLLASCALVVLFTPGSRADVIQGYNNDDNFSLRINYLRLGSSRDVVYSSLATTMYFYSIQQQATRCINYLNAFKDDFIKAIYNGATWEEIEDELAGNSIDTHPESLPPANPGTLREDLQLFYTISQRCITGIHHLTIDLSIHQKQIKFMDDILAFEEQVKDLLAILKADLDDIEITPLSNVTQQLLTTASYEKSRWSKCKKRDFLYLSNCFQGLEFINVVAVKH